MNYIAELPWVKVHEFLIDCGNIREPRQLSVQVIRKMTTLIPFDQARIYLINENGIVYDEILFGVDKRWTKAYHDYYSQVGNGRYSLFPNVSQTGSEPISVMGVGRVRDWTKCENDEFVLDYVKPQGLTYSTGFVLHDNHNAVKIMFMLDRVSRVKYSETEMNVLGAVQPHLDNLHRNLYVEAPVYDNVSNHLKYQTPLTAREAEIAELLSKGVSPANISKKLYISTTTVYKHITHIHTKLNVSNRQELLVKLLNTPES